MDLAHSEAGVKWADAISTPPSTAGFYFCWHERWGRVVMGWADGWGEHPPRMYLLGDGAPPEVPSPDCQKIISNGTAINARATA
jgi:hypothetical protein